VILEKRVKRTIIISKEADLVVDFTIDKGRLCHKPLDLLMDLFFRSFKVIISFNLVSCVFCYIADEGSTSLEKDQPHY